MIKQDTELFSYQKYAQYKRNKWRKDNGFTRNGRPRLWKQKEREVLSRNKKLDGKKKDYGRLYLEGLEADL